MISHYVHLFFCSRSLQDHSHVASWSSIIQGIHESHDSENHVCVNKKNAEKYCKDKWWTR